MKKPVTENKTGLTPQEQLSLIYARIGELMPVRDSVYKTAAKKLENCGIERVRRKNMSEAEILALSNYFDKEISPLLSPQIIDSRHPFPHLAGGQLHIAVKLEKNDGGVLLRYYTGAFDG